MEKNESHFSARPFVITIATFSKPEEAHLLRMRLGAADIPAFVRDEHLIQMFWLYANALGGVRVQIAEGDLAEAREFLAADAPQPCPEAVEVACPHCGSPDTAPSERPRRLAFLTLLLWPVVPAFLLVLLVLVLEPRRRWRCAACARGFLVPRLPVPPAPSTSQRDAWW